MSNPIILSFTPKAFIRLKEAIDGERLTLSNLVPPRSPKLEFAKQKNFVNRLFKELQRVEPATALNDKGELE